MLIRIKFYQFSDIQISKVCNIKNTSTEIAMSHNTSIENSENSTALTTAGFPTVSVPVLSNTIVFTCIEVANNK